MKRNLTFEQKVHWAESCNEIESEYAIHCYYHKTEDRPGLPSSIKWSVRRADEIVGSHLFGGLIGYAHAEEEWSAGMARGRAARAQQFRDKYEELRDRTDTRFLGGVGMHQLASSIIEVAEDGLSAKASFYTPGILASNLTLSGMQGGGWMWERYGEDWVFEDGEWKVLHNWVAEDYVADLDDENAAAAAYADIVQKGYLENTMMGPHSPWKGIDIQGPAHMDGTPFQLVQYNVKPPEPYDTLSHTWKYIPEPGSGRKFKVINGDMAMQAELDARQKKEFDEPPRTHG